MPRTSFNSPRLVRLLADLNVAEAGEPKHSFAERLSQWLDFTDAISLSAALKPVPAKVQAALPAAAALSGELARVRATLAEAIGAEPAGGVRGRLPTPATGASIEEAADFSPYHRYYLAHQRAMDGAIAPLRTRARAALSGLSPEQARLAALDGVLEEALGARERSLFATIPLLLARRFERLRSGHRAPPGLADDPERWMQPGGWLAGFCGEMQGALLAELDLRLQPVAGLIEAIGNEVTKQQ